MKKLSQFIRLIKINLTFARYGLDKIILTLPVFSPYRFLIYLNPYRWLCKEQLTRGVALRRALEELGPIFVKFGQALSTRRDLLPKDIVIELAKLQDAVPPFDPLLAEKMIESALGKSIGELFAEFNLEPLASASIAQVHSAKLHSGQAVIIKILRPGINKHITRDLALMKRLAQLVEKYSSEARRLHPFEVVLEFEKSIIDELDFMREAANASQLKRKFQNSHILYIPQVHWSHTCETVMVMERIYGIPISHIDTLRQHGVNIKLLAERGVEIFFTQVFRDSFFHADMHPGNLFVSFENPENPQYIAVDFGIMGTLSDFDQRYLAENLLAFFNRDYRKVAHLHVESGWVPSTTSINEFESAVRTVCEPIFERPLKDISFAAVLMRLFQVSRRFEMEVQPQLVLLQKTLLAVEGLGRHLYPELDLWNTAKPFLEKWIAQRVGFEGFIKKVQGNLPFWLEKMPDVPLLLHEILNTHKQQQLEHRDHIKKIQADFKKNKRKRRRSFLFGASFSLVIGAITLLLWQNQI